ncbi:MAG: MEDS domain-containing protein [Thaumarchaeota archaeon]|nr:MEDS domain-containing protein [Nitrososphaerota archaeon]MDE1867951.1 MEDS domain-containing protein [Nitrososphaerota archaeon]
MIKRSPYQIAVERGIVTEPFQYIDSLEGRRHIILVYDDQIEGKLIQFRFIRNGLRVGESCFYLTHQEPEIIEREMSESGLIDAVEWMKKGLLYIHKIPDISQDKEGMLEGCQKILKMVQRYKAPYRIVGRAISDVSTEMAMEAQYVLEKVFHSKFERTNGSFLCYYDWSQIGGNRLRWIERLSKTHHAMIFATKFKLGMAFNLEDVFPDSPTNYLRSPQRDSSC